MGIRHPAWMRRLRARSLRPSRRNCARLTTPLWCSASATIRRSTRSGPDVGRIPSYIRPTNETRPPWGGGSGRLEAVRLGELRVLAGQHLGEVDHDAALLPGRVVLHLAVDHVDAAAVRDGLDDLLGERDLFGVGGEDLLGDPDLDGVQRPCADAAQQERGAELGLAAK